MADQAYRIKSKQLVLQFKSPCLCPKTLMVFLLMLAASTCPVQTATCPPSVPHSATTTEQYSFTVNNLTQTLGVVGGQVSNSLYYMYYIYSSLSGITGVRKVDASDSQTWMASFVFPPIGKSLSVDATEQSVYLASLTSPLVVLKLAANDGAIVSQHQL